MRTTVRRNGKRKVGSCYTHITRTQSLPLLSNTRTCTHTSCPLYQLVLLYRWQLQWKGHLHKLKGTSPSHMRVDCTYHILTVLHSRDSQHKSLYKLYQPTTTISGSHIQPVHAGDSWGAAPSHTDQPSHQLNSRLLLQFNLSCMDRSYNKLAYTASDDDSTQLTFILPLLFNRCLLLDLFCLPCCFQRGHISASNFGCLLGHFGGVTLSGSVSFNWTNEDGVTLKCTWKREST